MKKFLPLSILAATAALALTGCVQQIGVSNPYDANNAQWFDWPSGKLVARYPGKTIDEVKVAVDHTFDARYGKGSRMGETQLQVVNPRSEPGWEVFARATGDIRVVVRITTEHATRRNSEAKPADGAPAPAPEAKPAEGPTEWTQIAIEYGAWGNMKESQNLIAEISNRLSGSR